MNDRRLEVRYVGPINGSYTLANRRSPGTNRVDVFACRTQSISVAAIAVQAPVSPDPGTWLTARFDGIGIVRGAVARQTDDGFLFTIVASDDSRKKLAAKISALRAKSTRPDDKRAFGRQQPADPRSALTFPDDRVERCFIIDYSRGGAAVSTRTTPDIGSSVVLGTLRCHVVRRLDVGFAVEFDAVQDEAGLENLICGYEPAAASLPPAVWPTQ